MPAPVTVKLNGGAHTTAMVYSPNAAVSFNGGGDFYGSVVGATIDDTGGAKIHYDRRLSGRVLRGRQRNDELVQLEEILTAFSRLIAAPYNRRDAVRDCPGAADCFV